MKPSERIGKILSEIASREHDGTITYETPIIVQALIKYLDEQYEAELKRIEHLEKHLIPMD